MRSSSCSYWYLTLMSLSPFWTILLLEISSESNSLGLYVFPFISISRISEILSESISSMASSKQAPTPPLCEMKNSYPSQSNTAYLSVKGKSSPQSNTRHPFSSPNDSLIGSSSSSGTSSSSSTLKDMMFLPDGTSGWNGCLRKQ